MQTIIDFFTPQVFAVIGIIIVLNILSTITRFYIAKMQARANLLELERTIQESETRLQQIMGEMETNRDKLLQGFQTFTDQEIARQQQEMIDQKNKNG